eukprot:15065837-Ditylum_brightwellii.AAC.1
MIVEAQPGVGIRKSNLIDTSTLGYLEGKLINFFRSSVAAINRIVYKLKPGKQIKQREHNAYLMD